MQEEHSNDIWTIVKEQGPLFTVMFVGLTSFITALFTKRLYLGWYVLELKAEIADLKAQLAKREEKVEKCEAAVHEMTDLMKANTLTTSAAVEGFKRGLEDRDRRDWSGEEQRNEKRKP